VTPASKPPKVVNCPTCGAPVTWEPISRYRPFCSERCRTQDFCAWASESYRIPEAEAANGASDDTDA